MNSAKYRFLMLIAVLSLASAATLSGQTAVTGGITGEVTDTLGAAVIDASAEAKNTDTSVSEKVVTNRDGVYRFPSLIPGPYSVRGQRHRPGSYPSNRHR